MKFRINAELTSYAVETFLVCLDTYNKIQASVDWNAKDIKETKVSKDSHTKMFDQLRNGYCSKYLINQNFDTKELAYLEVRVTTGSYNGYITCTSILLK